MSSNDGFETASPDKVGNGLDREEDQEQEAIIQKLR